MSKMIVTITPPTPNGGLHLGHLAGPFLSADVYARAQRQSGHQVLLVCYSDDYQSYLARKARELGREPQQVSAKYAAEIAETLARANIELDSFLVARDNVHFLRCVGEHYRSAIRAGAIGSCSLPVPYCATCDLFGYEAFARGGCNHCGEPSDASQCEECAAAPDACLMTDMRCTQCKSTVSWRTVPRKLLHLGAFRDDLRVAHQSSTPRRTLRAFIDRTLDLPDLDWPINRPHEHGVPIGGDDGTELISTWFSGLAGYQACLEEMSARPGSDNVIQGFWQDRETTLVHFLGFDCSFSHAIAYRAILQTLEHAPRRTRYYTNAFLKLDGSDFSTSRGHAIWVSDTLKEVDADVLRRYLLGVAPEEETANFDSAEFAAWAPRAQRECLEAIDRAREIAVPRLQLLEALAYAQHVQELRRDWQRATDPDEFSGLRLSRVLELAFELALATAWPGDEARATALAALAAVARSVMPRFAAWVANGLGLDACVLDQWLSAPAQDWPAEVSRRPVLAATTA